MTNKNYQEFLLIISGLASLYIETCILSYMQYIVHFLNKAIK
jgi:hypothetical protein